MGRTGAGKTSLIAGLFRLALNEGQIVIDDKEIHEMGLHDLRSTISIIPQEPVLFSGTLRKNLDPIDEYPDHILWNALDEVTNFFFFKLRNSVENGRFRLWSVIGIMSVQELFTFKSNNRYDCTIYFRLNSKIS